MSNRLELCGLEGTNPLGFLAALGALEALTRAGRPATLAFTEGLVPLALLAGADDVADLVAVLDADRRRWQASPVLTGPSEHPLDEVKPDRATTETWAAEVANATGRGRSEVDLFCGLVAEGAVDGSEKGKPTHLHFTAGQQRFLGMARELARGVDADRMHEAVAGPWRDDSILPSFSWDGRGSKPYAVRASDPSKLKRKSVPGADWLALLGLASLPVRAVANRFTGKLALETTACDRAWKRSAFRWPLWWVDIGLPSVRSLLGDPALVGTAKERGLAVGAGAPLADILAARGVLRVLEAPIRRTDQGGYGSFGGATTIAEARPAR